MWAFNLPSCFWRAVKYRCDFLSTIAINVKPSKPDTTAVIAINALVINIIIITPKKRNIAATKVESDWLRVCAIRSTSLVTRESVSPVRFLSKKRSGSLLILAEMRFLSKQEKLFETLVMVKFSIKPAIRLLTSSAIITKAIPQMAPRFSSEKIPLEISSVILDSWFGTTIAITEPAIAKNTLTRIPTRNGLSSLIKRLMALPKSLDFSASPREPRIGPAIMRSFLLHLVARHWLILRLILRKYLILLMIVETRQFGDKRNRILEALRAYLYQHICHYPTR